ncbi:TetR/AcrR family transcriptional regulator [Paenibacillus agri]|uniref:TetR/AcrR family transcriptional regulator n=1 Tax=Paenibacillus agri TaxID=2744309 RepID=A0A850EXC9_9BACL|nr:TetR/AcrR family transcriptional regulator [Paenibacillus agri]NUU64299.1 TetR/AcrR family transcriptional regulator [Paenibacillus agri]
MKKTEKASLAPIDPANQQTIDPYHERILNAARELFKASGLENVSMYSIAKQAGIGQGSLYRRFTDKGEICSALLRDSTGRFLTELEREAQSSNADDPALQRLQNSIEQVVDFIDQHAELLHLIKSEFVGKKQLTQFEHPFFRRVNVIFTELLSQAAENGEIVNIDPHFTVTALLSVLSPDLYLYQQKAHQSTKEDITQGILTLFIDGLVRKKR